MNVLDKYNWVLKFLSSRRFALMVSAASVYNAQQSDFPYNRCGLFFRYRIDFRHRSCCNRTVASSLLDLLRVESGFWERNLRVSIVIVRLDNLRGRQYNIVRRLKL